MVRQMKWVSPPLLIALSTHPVITQLTGAPLLSIDPRGVVLVPLTGTPRGDAADRADTMGGTLPVPIGSAIPEF